MFQMSPVFLNPFITVVEFVIPVALSRSMAVMMFFKKMFGAPDDRLLVHNRSLIRTAALVF
jgi:hypothetical protein